MQREPFDYRHAYLLLVEHLRDMDRLARQDRSPAILQSAVIRTWAVVQGLEADEAQDWASRHVFTEVGFRDPANIYHFLSALNAKAAEQYAALSAPVNPIQGETK